MREGRKPGTPDEHLSRRQRLTHSLLFQETYAQGQRWVGRYMVLWLRKGPGAALRLGVVASRKVGGAVARNRARRRLREAYRRNRGRLTGERDVVLVARRELLRAEWDDVVGELMALAEKAGLVEGDKEP
jgi:ribonuclease P protein component